MSSFRDERWTNSGTESTGPPQRPRRVACREPAVDVLSLRERLDQVVPQKRPDRRIRMPDTVGAMGHHITRGDFPGGDAIADLAGRVCVERHSTSAGSSD